MELDRDFSEFIACCDAREVRYLVVGGYALAADRVVQLGRAPKRIDLLTSIDGVEFDACWSRRILIELGGRKVPFLARADLLANKRAAARLQDLADVEVLVRDAPPGT